MSVWRFSASEGVIQDGATTPETTLATHTAQIAALQSATSPVTYTAAGLITPTGIAILKAGSAAAMTVAVPPAGASLTIIAADAWAYTVTTTANKINGNADKITFGGAVGDSIQLSSDAGIWYSGPLVNVTLSEV